MVDKLTSSSGVFFSFYLAVAPAFMLCDTELLDYSSVNGCIFYQDIST